MRKEKLLKLNYKQNIERKNSNNKEKREKKTVQMEILGENKKNEMKKMSFFL